MNGNGIDIASGFETAPLSPVGHGTMRRSGGCWLSGHLATLILIGLWIGAAAVAQTPWSGAPSPVPGSMEAESFDRGGEGIAYHDAVAGNAGGQYRTTEDVDIVTGPNGGYVVNNFQTGEWLGYTIDVAADGDYLLELHASTNFDFPNSAYHVELDGRSIGSAALADSGGWTTFQWLGPVRVSLTAGTHTLRIVSDRQYFNLDALRLRAQTVSDEQDASDELMPASEDGWAPFSARAQTAPATSAWHDGSDYVLSVSGNGVANEYGGWRARIQALQGGQFYRFRARARARYVESLRESVSILLRWRGNFGDEVKPDYVWDYEQQADGWLYFDRVIQAPSGTASVDVELVLQWAETGVLDVSQLSFRAVASPPPRPVRVAAVYFRPWASASGVDSVQRAADYGRQVAAQYGPDIMVFGELLNVIGAPGSMESKAESIPGTSTEIMSALAREHGVNVVVGLLENSNGQLYNTAILIDRSGEIIGKYHKVQLPVEDASAGIAPGNQVPVFDTDVGRVAMLVCHDVAFPEPAREAALQGAEMILLPIWGGKSALVRARAIENSVYVVSSGYDYASDVVNPLGDVLDRIAAINGDGQVAVADIDLGRRFREEWLGDWRDVANKERRTRPYAYEVP